MKKFTGTSQTAGIIPSIGILETILVPSGPKVYMTYYYPLEKWNSIVNYNKTIYSFIIFFIFTSNHCRLKVIENFTNVLIVFT